MIDAEKVTFHNGTLAFTGKAMGNGSVVLMLHGFPDSINTFDAQIPAFAAAGYRAVTVTMRGYEPSSQPADGDYHVIRMAEDVVAWIDQLGVPKIHLVGHDWGANIAYATAALAPDRLASLTTIAVPHPLRFAEAFATDPEQQVRSAYIMEFQTPGFENQILSNDCVYLEALWKSWSPEWSVPPPLLAAMKATMSQPGVARAALEYYRQAFDVTSEAALQGHALFTRPITAPTLGICGEQDRCITAGIFVNAMRRDDFANELRVEQVAGAGHFTHAEAPASVNAIILDWISLHSE